ncbi:MAG: hypothetical protein KGP28_00385 [Bdellovibrionales bacterium]|nr:hypothetical protein [Bdellovibrionales bacterium]
MDIRTNKKELCRSFIHSLTVLGIFFASCLLTPRVFAAPADVKRFQRCYAMFTGMRVPSDDARLAAVKSGSKTAANACMEVFDLATLGSNNRISTTTEPALATSILKRFHEWGRGYGKDKDFFNSFETDHTAEIQDPYLMANAITFLLLKPNQSFSKLVTDTMSYRTIRERNQTPSGLISNPYLGIEFYYQTWTSGELPLATPATLVRQGRLVGIEPSTTVNPFPHTPGRFPEKNMNANLGGGILGAQGYLLAKITTNYFNRIPDTTESTYRKDSMVNGVSNTPRRLAKTILSDLLCRELPALHESDVVNLASAAYTVPFRKATGCTSCHATMDPLAAVYRNQVPIRSMDANSHRGFRFFATRTPDLALNEPISNDSIFPPNGDDPDFYRKPPRGTLRFKSYDGTLVEQQVNGIADLGTKISLTKDFYVCAASKFYRFLTGVRVNLADITHPNTAPLSPGATAHRNLVIQLGADSTTGLMAHKSLRTLIRQIIETNAFLNPGVAP